MAIMEILQQQQIIKEEEIVITAELIEDKDEDDEEVIFTLPTQRQYEEEINKKVELQNQTHSDKCGVCVKFSRTTPNPRSKFGLCRWNGVMVLEHQTSCEKYKLDSRKQEKSNWS